MRPPSSGAAGALQIDVTDVLAYLVGAKSGYTNGICLHVDGGIVLA
jgi:hypothetical protein